MTPRAQPPEPNGYASLAGIIKRFRRRRILVVGDVILDRYLWGDVERTSPEAPVPIVTLRNQTATLGGAANVAANLASLGALPAVVGVIGLDEAGAEFRRVLGEIGVAPGGLVVDPLRPTTVKTRVIALGQQLIRLDKEQDSPLATSIAAKLMAKFRTELRRAGAVVLSDYGKGVLGRALCEAFIRAARKSRVPVIVDPKGIDYAKYRGASVIKPNRKEAEAATGCRIDSAEGLSRAAAALLRQTGATGIVISRGGEGASVFERGNRKPVHIAAQARSVYDVTGAGDSFIAAMALALAAGSDLPDAARLGNAAGSVVVGKLGAATVNSEELARAIQPGSSSPSKIRSSSQLRRELDALRASGKQIIFTNGCFDLFHPGQIKFLEEARRLGDVLVVAINSDRSVRAVKGAPRPVLGQAERGSLLSSLDSVDFVVVFDELTPKSLVSMLRPDILVKGKSMQKTDIVGREIIEGYGGRVVVLPQMGSLTTDSVVRRIAKGSRSKS